MKRFQVVVLADGLASLHTVEVREGPRGHVGLDVVARNEVVEPMQQSHWHTGDYAVTGWALPGGERRYAWLPVTKAPSSEDEAVDRVVALHAVRIRRLLRELVPDYVPATRLYAYVESREDIGDGVFLCDRERMSPRSPEPARMRRAVQEDRHRGRVPLLVSMNELGYWGLRWIALAAEDASRARGVEMIEHVPHVPPVRDPNDTIPPGPYDGGGRLDSLWASGLHHLATCDAAALDSDIAGVGFDPREEREHGPGLRERVMTALVDKRWARVQAERAASR
jgi:hypothetical protein